MNGGNGAGRARTRRHSPELRLHACTKRHDEAVRMIRCRARAFYVNPRALRFRVHEPKHATQRLSSAPRHPFKRSVFAVRSHNLACCRITMHACASHFETRTNEDVR